MNLKQLINKSVCGVTGYISSLEDISILEQYIVYNLSVLKECKLILVATNYKDINLTLDNTTVWKKYFPDCVLLDSEVNRGHNFGTADLDNMVFDWCKQNNEEWLFKTAIDFIFNSSILDIEIKEADFYYLNGIGYGGMTKYNFDFNRIINEDFFPQTNFYFINVNKTDYLNNKQYLDETYEYIQSLPNYNGRIWEYIQGWECEGFLKQCIERNDLSKYHLVSQEKYNILLQIIEKYNIHDPSHKNIMINGICHLQYPQQQIIEI